MAEITIDSLLLDPSGIEKRSMEIESQVNPGISTVYDIGTIHYTNAYTGDGTGRYNLEVIQAGGVNHFTNPESTSGNKLNAADLFYSGSCFTVEDYRDFFHEGRMDDGSIFGYRIDILEVSQESATVRITRA